MALCFAFFPGATSQHPTPTCLRLRLSSSFLPALLNLGASIRSCRWSACQPAVAYCTARANLLLAACRTLFPILGAAGWTIVLGFTAYAPYKLLGLTAGFGERASVSIVVQKQQAGCRAGSGSGCDDTPWSLVPCARFAMLALPGLGSWCAEVMRPACAAEIDSAVSLQGHLGHWLAQRLEPRKLLSTPRSLPAAKQATPLRDMNHLSCHRRICVRLPLAPHASPHG